MSQSEAHQSSIDPDAEVPILMPLIEPGGSDPLPDAWNEGAALFEQADTRCQEQAYGDAAELFLGAARALRGADASSFADAAVGGRQAAYHNAWECFVAAGQERRGREVLQRAAAEDPALAREIAELLVVE